MAEHPTFIPAPRIEVALCVHSEGEARTTAQALDVHPLGRGFSAAPAARTALVGGRANTTSRDGYATRHKVVVRLHIVLVRTDAGAVLVVLRVPETVCDRTMNKLLTYVTSLRIT